MIQQSHHRPDGGYRNPWPGDVPHGYRDFWRWRVTERGRNPLPPRPPASAFPLRASTFDSPRASARVLTVTWIGHATALLQLGRINVLTDPMWSRRASPVSWLGPARLVPPAVALDALPPLDVILISHNHYDHLDRDTVRAIAQRDPGATWFAPLGLARLLVRWGACEVRELDWWSQDRTGDAMVTCVPARHFSARGLRDRGATLWCGWTVAADGWRAYFAGDTAYHPEFTRIAQTCGPFDIALLPIGAYEPRWFMGSVHMNPEDAIGAWRDLSAGQPGAAPPAMIPVHWGTFILTDEPAEEPPVRARRRWDEAGLPSDELWLMAHGETHRRERTR